jgi:glycosyltransferase involved in cell wall biosynthesis
MSQATLRIAVNGLHAKSGGGVTYLRNIMPLLARDERLELHLFLGRQQHGLFPDLPEQIRVHLLDLPESLPRLLLWEQVTLPILLREMRADVTFSPANYGPLAAPRPVIMLRNALSVAQLETRLSKRVYWFVLTVMTALSLMTARHSIAVSRYARDSLPGPLRQLAKRRCEIIHHGIDSTFSPDPKGTPREDFLLAVSDIYVQKNLHGLVEAMALAARARPGLKLLVAGRILDPDYYQTLIERITALGLDAQITFLGSVPPRDLPSLYRRCRAFIFPSTVETFGNPLVEAMACGAPIICSNSAAMPEVLGDAGLYFDPTDKEDMAAKIETLLADDILAEQLSYRGRERAGGFSWEICARQTAAILTATAGS